MKLIFALREPVARAYSDYWMGLNRGRGPSRFEDVLAEQPWRTRYIEAGYYDRHLARFYALLSAEQILVVTFEGMTSDPVGTMLRICQFIGATGELPHSVGSAVNANIEFRSLRLRTAAKAWPSPLRRLVGKFNAKKSPYPAMHPETRQELQELYAPHNAALAEMLPELDLSGW